MRASVQGQDSGGLSRRELIKRSAIVGGAAWTAPMVIDSLTSPAGASSPPPGGYQCSYILVAYKWNGGVYVAKFDNGASTASCTGNGGQIGDLPAQPACNGYEFKGGAGLQYKVGSSFVSVPTEGTCASRVYLSGPRTVSAVPGVSILFFVAHDGAYDNGGACDQGNGTKLAWGCGSGLDANSVTAPSCCK